VTGDDLAATFDATAPFTVAAEEKVMLLDPRTLELSDCAPKPLKRLESDPAFKPGCRHHAIRCLSAAPRAMHRCHR
jgi:hypothetical protein